MSAGLAGQRVLVAGASGFYGRNLLVRLAGSGAEVLATSRGPAPPGAPAGAWHQADLADPAQTAALFAAFRPQIVFHLTSASLGGLERANVRASVAADLLPTLNVLEAAAEAGVARVILPCSMEEPFPVADAAGELAVPETPYAMSKLVTSLYGR
ncbi:MAG: NAD-dependent epimerase/dehydratase family protein, partial [Alphaproteobacteria bacterium]|nr:NAD-dependent epimerase/dehydratase family protein [Alphaproteobacteria bacterium]